MELTAFLHSYYEGYSIREITFPIRVLKLLGINLLIGISLPFAIRLDFWIDILTLGCEVTNAAGGLNSEYKVGDLVILNDVSGSVRQLFEFSFSHVILASQSRRSIWNSSITWAKR